MFAAAISLHTHNQPLKAEYVRHTGDTWLEISTEGGSVTLFDVSPEEARKLALAILLQTSSQSPQEERAA